MVLEKLITQGAGLDPTVTNTSWWVWIIVGLVAVFFILSAVVLLFMREFGGTFTVLIVGFVACLFVYLVLSDSSPNPEYTKWESNAHKYIEDLPQEKHEIVYIKIDPESTTEVSGTFFLGFGSISSQSEYSTPVTVAYKVDDEVRLETFWTETNMQLSEDIKPYLTYQNLPKNLGHGIESGWYNPTVHLPSNYEFTDIK